MEKIVLVVHLIIAIAMVLVVLMQRSEGAGLAGSSGSGMMPVRGSGNALTRITAVLATLFFITSLTLAILAGSHRSAESVADEIAAQPATTEQPAAAPAPVAPPVAP